MNYRDRAKLLNKLANDEHFAALASHRDRVQHVLKHHGPYRRFRQIIKSNMEMAQSQVGKSLTRATMYKTEADAFVRRAQDVNTVDCEEFWNLALESYTKVNCTCHLLIMDQFNNLIINFITNNCVVL